MREPGAVPGSDGQSCRQDTDQYKIEFAIEDIAKCRGYRNGKLNRLTQSNGGEDRNTHRYQYRHQDKWAPGAAH